MTDLTQADVNLIQQVLYDRWHDLDRQRRQPMSVAEAVDLAARQTHLEEIREKLQRLPVA